MKKRIVCILSIAIVAICATCVWAAQSTTVNVNVGVPTISGGLNMMVSKIEGDGNGTWTDKQISMDFGTLRENTKYNIFMPENQRRYAIDIGVRDNSGTIWTLTHTRNSIKKDATNNLDYNVNVAFVKQANSTTGTVDKYVSFADSNNISYTKTDLGTGWLRIYYGIGTGDTAKPDASGVTPIGLDKPAGTYTGSITITLTP